MFAYASMHVIHDSHALLIITRYYHHIHHSAQAISISNTPPQAQEGTNIMTLNLVLRF